MKKSLSSTIVEKLLFKVSNKQKLTDQQQFERNLQEILKKGEIPYKINYKKFIVDTKKKVIDGMDYYVLNSKGKKNKNKIMYFHGGAYAYQPYPFHWLFLNKLAISTKTEIWVPIYPKVPFHDAEYAYKCLIKLYEVFASSIDNEKIIFMGDSAGGGLVLGMSQKIRDMGFKNQPNELIMISPWLDVTMTSPNIKKIESKDSMLGSYGLCMYGKLWAGNKDTKDFIVSPLYGNLDKLGKITIFTGTHDILNSDARALLEKTREQNIPIDFIEKEDMQHAYPLLPISEAKEAMKKIRNIIIGK